MDFYLLNAGPNDRIICLSYLIIKFLVEAMELAEKTIKFAMKEKFLREKQ
jgi:hypothetical protein